MIRVLFQKINVKIPCIYTITEVILRYRYENYAVQFNPLKQKIMKTIINIFATVILIISFSNANASSVSNNTNPTNPGIKMHMMKIANGIVTVSMVDQKVGNYSIQLMDGNNHIIASSTIHHTSATANETVSFGKTLTGGQYTIVLTTTDNQSIAQKLILLM